MTTKQSETAEKKQALVKVADGEWLIKDTSKEKWFAVSFVKGKIFSMKRALLEHDKHERKMNRTDCHIQTRWDEFKGIVTVTERYCPTRFCKFIPTK